MSQWKRRNRIGEEQRVYCISGGHPHFKKALGDRGWVSNKDTHSTFFDLKWAQKGKDIDTGALQSGQIVNHFQHTGALTTKIGLCSSMRSLHFYAAADPDHFYPRTYNLYDDEDRTLFRI